VESKIFANILTEKIPKNRITEASKHEKSFDFIGELRPLMQVIDQWKQTSKFCN
jgi:hypothetical protein